MTFLNFGIPFNIKYETGDASVHYLTSRMFTEEDRLLIKVDDEIYGDFQGRKIGSYSNTGIIMECLSNVVSEIDCYKIFIAFDIFVLCMSGIMMYSTLEKFTKCNKSKLLALAVSIIYVMGYPLNSLLFGFEYLSLGILVVCTILHMIYYFEKEELKFVFYLIIFALLNFGLFSSYYMFVPFTYSALWIYFCRRSHKQGTKETKIKWITPFFPRKEDINSILLISITLVVPFVLGFVYHLVPELYSIFYNGSVEKALDYSSYILSHSFKLDGYIYINYYSSIILFVPLTVYYIYKRIKAKEWNNFEILEFAGLIIFMIILFICVKLEKVSEYFLMKNYFILWLMVIYINFKSLIDIFDKDKIVAGLILGVYVFIIVVNLIFINMPLNHDNVNESLWNVAEIFGVNKTMILERPKDVTPEEIEVLKYAKDNLDFLYGDIEILGEDEQTYWVYVLLRYVSYYDELDEYGSLYGGQEKLFMKYKNAINRIGKVDYMIYFKRCEFYERAKDKLFENAEVLYENDAGGIVRYMK